MPNLLDRMVPTVTHSQCRLSSPEEVLGRFEDSIKPLVPALSLSFFAVLPCDYALVEEHLSVAFILSHDPTTLVF